MFDLIFKEAWLSWGYISLTCLIVGKQFDKIDKVERNCKIFIYIKTVGDDLELEITQLSE